MRIRARRTLPVRLTSGLPKRFVVRTPRGHYFVRAEDIETATADGNYVALSAGGRVHLVRETMKSFEAKVDPAHFVRIHRSTVVNVGRIREVQPWMGGDHLAILRDGTQLRVSRTYRGALLRPDL